MGVDRKTIEAARDRVPRSNDRRRMLRERVGFPDALLGWWDESNFTTRSVQLINLSMSGCLVEAPQHPRRAEQQAVWLRPLAVAPSEWIQGVVVSIHKPLFKRCRIRLSFLAPFPYDSYKALVYGADLPRDPLKEQTPEHEQDHHWK
jgi:hypothetical protein